MTGLAWAISGLFVVAYFDGRHINVRRGFAAYILMSLLEIVLMVAIAVHWGSHP